MLTAQAYAYDTRFIVQAYCASVPLIVQDMKDIYCTILWETPSVQAYETLTEWLNTELGSVVKPRDNFTGFLEGANLENAHTNINNICFEKDLMQLQKAKYFTKFIKTDKK